jgi:oligopeptide/dipeptide ABC transporter ATP-binding protein
MTATVLDIADVAVHFTPRGGLFKPAGAPVKAVDGVSLQVMRGETVGLVGESGCGKSTLSNAVLGIVPATRGTIRVVGREVTGASATELHAIRADVQMVFQDPALSLNPRLPVGQAVAEPLLVRGVASGDDLKRRVAALLASVGLDASLGARYPHEFSGGQKQRVVIARALALQPKLVVCDEPVSALDVSVRAQIINLLVALQKEQGVAYLFVSHDLAVVRHIADRIAVMYLGRLVETASTAVLFAEPRHPYTKALLSAVPEPDPVRQRAKRRQVLVGELPSPSDVPPGCAFHTRCPIATDICRRERPDLTERPGGARVACHHA